MPIRKKRRHIERLESRWLLATNTFDTGFALGSEVPSVEIGGVEVEITPSSGSQMTVRQGSIVSAPNFISTSGGNDFETAQPIAFEFEDPVVAFGFKSINLFEGAEPNAYVSLTAFDDDGRIVSRVRRVVGESATNPILDWEVAGTDAVITRAVLNGNAPAPNYGLDDLSLVPNCEDVDSPVCNSAEPFVVTSTNDNDEKGTLRWAINQANARLGFDRIDFDIPGSGIHTVQLASELPDISDAVTIDGLSQGDTNGAPLIELAGTNAGDRAHGLVFGAGASNSLVRGLAINDFQDHGIILAGDDIVVSSNFIGLDPSDGITAKGNKGNGIEIQGSSGNLIGGHGPEFGNAIAGNQIRGVNINGSFNELLSNRIGVDSSAAQAVNAGVDAIFVVAGYDNRIGAIDAGNIVGGRANAVGVHIVSQETGRNLVQGNFLFANAAGANLRISPELNSNPNHAIRIANSNDNVIGGSDPGAGNVIANSFRGIDLGPAGTDVPLVSVGNVVQGNYIGTDREGRTLSNSVGVFLNQTADTHVGGLLPGARNIIAGNTSAGVEIQGGEARNEVIGNLIGVFPSDGEFSALSNLYGVKVYAASNNFVGNNIISGNESNGVFLQGAHQNEIAGNWVGTDENGSTGLGNGGHGIYVFASSGNQIGGLTAGSGNTIVGSVEHGIQIQQPTASGNSVLGNFIGVTGSGSMIPNSSSGIQLANAPNNVIGRTRSLGANRIAGNLGDEIGITGPASMGNEVYGNVIGGLEFDQGGQVGIEINEGASNNRIGGDFETQGNLITGQQSSAILVDQANSNDIEGNRILDNQFDAVTLRGDFNRVRNNNIESFGAVGIRVENGWSNTIRENQISTDQGNIDEAGFLQMPVDIGPIGRNENDPGDTDVGANGLINSPGNLGLVVRENAAVVKSDLLFGEGSIFPVTIDFYSSADSNGTRTVGQWLGSHTFDSIPAEVDSSVFAEMGFEASTTDNRAVTVDSTVFAELDFRPEAGSRVVATVTDCAGGQDTSGICVAGNTSEFSDVAVARQTLPPTFETDSPLSPSIVVAFDLGSPASQDGTFAGLAPSVLVDEVPVPGFSVGDSPTLSSSNETDLFRERTIHDFGDKDYFLLKIPRNSGNFLSSGTLVVELNYERDEGDLDLQAFDAKGIVSNEDLNETRLLAESSSTSGMERLAFPVVAEQLLGEGEDELEIMVVVKGFANDMNGESYGLTFTLDASDVDADGIPDNWERFGVPYRSSDDQTILLAGDTRRRDLYVEVDYVAGRRPEDLTTELMNEIRASYPRMERVIDVVEGIDEGQLWEQANLARTGTVLDLVVASFLLAPVESRDEDITGIRLHIDLDEEIPDDGVFQTWEEFLLARNNFFGTALERAQPNWSNDGELAKRNAYRYAIFGEQLATRNDFGRASLGSNDFVVALTQGEGARQIPTLDYALQQAGVFMHELGHTLGLRHGGNEDRNYKPNYISVMNYAWIVPRDRLIGNSWTLDFSRHELATIDRRNLEDHPGIACEATNATPAELRETYEGVIVPLGSSPVPKSIDDIYTVDALSCGDTDWQANDEGERDITRLDPNAAPWQGEDRVEGFEDWSNLRFRYTYTELVNQDDYGGEVFGEEPDSDLERNDENPWPLILIERLLEVLREGATEVVNMAIDSDRVDVDQLTLASGDVEGTLTVQLSTEEESEFSAFCDLCGSEQGAEELGPMSFMFSSVTGPQTIFIPIGSDYSTVLSVEGNTLFDVGNYDLSWSFTPSLGSDLDYLNRRLESDVDDKRLDFNSDDSFDIEDVNDYLADRQTVRGDANLDGIVDQMDRQILWNTITNSEFGRWTGGDFNGDQRVDDEDYNSLRENAVDIMFCDKGIRTDENLVQFDGACDATDIDRAIQAVASNEYAIELDENLDGRLDAEDRLILLDGVLSGDVDLNGTVDFTDFLVLSSNFGQSGGWNDGDSDGTGEVNFADFLALSSNFGRTVSREGSPFLNRTAG